MVSERGHVTFFNSSEDCAGALDLKDAWKSAIRKRRPGVDTRTVSHELITALDSWEKVQSIKKPSEKRKTPGAEPASDWQTADALEGLVSSVSLLLSNCCQKY